MKLKKLIAIALCGAAIAAYNGEAQATPTMVQSVHVPQELMNAEGNNNYVLVWQHLGTKFYIDLTSIVVKENDNVRWWAQNIIELDENGKYLGQFTQEFCLDMTSKKLYENTKQWNADTKQWESLNTYDTKSRNQADARAFNLGYMFAFQGGNPIEK